MYINMHGNDIRIWIGISSGIGVNQAVIITESSEFLPILCRERRRRSVVTKWKTQRIMLNQIRKTEEVPVRHLDRSVLWEPRWIDLRTCQRGGTFRSTRTAKLHRWAMESILWATCITVLEDHQGGRMITMEQRITAQDKNKGNCMGRRKSFLIRAVGEAATWVWIYYRWA